MIVGKLQKSYILDESEPKKQFSFYWHINGKSITFCDFLLLCAKSIYIFIVIYNFFCNMKISPKWSLVILYSLSLSLFNYASWQKLMATLVIRLIINNTFYLSALLIFSHKGIWKFINLISLLCTCCIWNWIICFSFLASCVLWTIVCYMCIMDCVLH